MNLVIDIGNTRFKWAVFHNNKMLKFESSKKFSSNFVKKIKLEYPELKNVCLSDNTNLNFDYKTIFSSFNLNYIELNSQCKLPITINYSTPFSLGSDRIALSVAAENNFKGNKLIIDLGTCITYDVVLNSNYIGGQISPGLQMRFASLHHYTDKLPKLDYINRDISVGQSTRDSILVGVYDSIFFEIESVVNKYKRLYPTIVTIATGGDMNIIEKKIKNINFFSPYLLMEGLNSIIAFNEEV